MFEAFWQDLMRVPLLQAALLSGVLCSVACGVVGTYVVVRRISYIAGGIAHCVLGGIGFARYAAVTWGWSWLQPLYGALAAAVLAALVIGWVSLRARQREDTVISALYAVGMALGVIFIKLTPGYAMDAQAYLFGSILMVASEQLWLIVALDVLVVGLCWLLFNPLLAVCFDEEFARLRGIRVELLYILLLVVTALTVVVLASIVGIVLVIALLTLPVAVAGYFCRTLGMTMVVATGLCMLFTTGGLAISYAPDLPPGPTIIVVSGAAYLLATAGRRLIPAGLRGR